MSKEYEITAQIVGHKSLKITGGLRVEIDIPDIKPLDVSKIVVLAINKANVRLVIKPYDKCSLKTAPKEYK